MEALDRVASRVLNFLFRISLHELGAKFLEKIEGHLLIVAHIGHDYEDIGVLLEDVEVKPE